MPLLPESQLGNYEIVERLGAGGMGEVYRARDTRLGRAVAIKVILETYAADPERAARFQREAKMLAALNHPRIAALYGIEQAGGIHFLVMELVEGETLADRLRRGAMQVEEAIAIALQIAEALEAAHEKGVVHRDLKPANIKITPDHQVKVLDFGLAKAIDIDQSAAVANSPTLSMMATQAGVILGTAAYMSPEQAKGFAVDHRSDVFSFGTVLFEMLTGRQPFQGDTAAEVLASVLVREAEVSGLPADTNPRLIELVARCLQKSPKRRWQHIGDVRAELESLARTPRSTILPAFVPVPARPLWKRALIPAACALVAAAIAGTAAWRFKPEPRPAVVTFSHVLPEGQRFTNAGRPLFAISPDGATLVYSADRQLYRRALSDLHAVPIQGTALPTQGVTSPSFSPDGKWVAFYTGGDQTLKRVPVGGGVAVTICPAANPDGLDWTKDGIVFAQSAHGIMRVAAEGGKPELIAAMQPHERAHMPQMLPDGDTILYSVATGAGADRWDKGRVIAQSLRTGVRKTLIEGASAARYLTSGHLTYALDRTLLARPFDLRTLELRGSAVPVLEGVARSAPNQTGVVQASVSGNGTLAYIYRPAPPASPQFDLALVDRGGAITRLKLPPGSYDAPRLSPDGTKVVMSDLARVLVYELSGATALRRLTFGGNNRFPIWSADGSRVTFQSDREGDAGIFWQDADDSGEAIRLTRPVKGAVHTPESWSPDGQTLLFDVQTTDGHELWTLSMRDGKTTQFADVVSRVPTRPHFSPDGRWIVYTTSDGVMSVQVQAFPANGARQELLRRRSESPHDALWSRDGREIIYVPRPLEFGVVQVTTRPSLSFGNPTILARLFSTGGPTLRRQFDVTRDGKFLTLIPAEQPDASGTGRLVQEIRIVLNWVQQLAAKVPAR